MTMIAGRAACNKWHNLKLHLGHVPFPDWSGNLSLQTVEKQECLACTKTTLCCQFFHIIFFFFTEFQNLSTWKPAVPTLVNKKKAIERNLLSIQNEAISLVGICSKELWLVRENHATNTLESCGRLSWNEIELTAKAELICEIYKSKMSEKSSQFLSSEEPCGPKS